MALIQNIRKRSGLVITVITIAMALFLINDAITSNSSLFSSNENSVGTIAGEDIAYQEYANYFGRFLKNYSLNTGDASPDVTKTFQVNEQAWQSMIEERILGSEYKDLGLEVSSEELWDMIQGPNPDQNIIKAFTDDKGQFNRDNLINFLQNLDQVPEEQRKSWLSFEEGLQTEKIRTKYFNLISKGTYVTDLEAENDYLSKNKSASIKYVALLAKDIPDSTITVTDEEINAYAKKNAKDYEQNDERTVKYASFPVVASKNDTLNLRNKMETLKAEFQNSTKDFDFAFSHSDGIVDTAFKAHGEVGEKLENDVFTAELGTVFGPYLEFGSFKLSKVSELKDGEKTYYRAAHILFKPAGNTEEDSTEARKKAAQVLKELKDGADFSDKAIQYGSDGTSTKGGDLGWFTDGAMVPRFEKAIQKGKLNELSIVNTKFGPHIIKITAEPSKKLVKVITIEKKISPSAETEDIAYTAAKNFEAMAVDAAGFAKAVTELKVDLKIAENLKPMDVAVTGIKDARRMIKWAYEQKAVDAVSEIFEFDEEYVIAFLNEIKIKGELDITSRKDEITETLKKEKKLAQLSEKMNSVYTNDLEAIAQKLNTTVGSASNINLKSPVVAELGNEPILTGSILGIKEQTVSKVIEGSEGVYVITIEGFSEVQLPENYIEYKKSILSSNAASSQFYSLNALKEHADIVDKRYLFF